MKIVTMLSELKYKIFIEVKISEDRLKYILLNTPRDSQPLGQSSAD